MEASKRETWCACLFSGRADLGERFGEVVKGNLNPEGFNRVERRDNMAGKSKIAVVRKMDEKDLDAVVAIGHQSPGQIKMGLLAHENEPC